MQVNTASPGGHDDCLVQEQSSFLSRPTSGPTTPISKDVEPICSKRAMDRSEVNKRYRWALLEHCSPTWQPPPSHPPLHARPFARERSKQKSKAELDGLRREINSLRRENVCLKQDNVRLLAENSTLQRSRRAFQRSRHFALLALGNISEVLNCEEALSESILGTTGSPEGGSVDVRDLIDGLEFQSFEGLASIISLDDIDPIINLNDYSES